jgi:ketosteroid isomerase-like protein
MLKRLLIPLLLCATAFSQAKPATQAAASSKEVPSAALLQKIIAAWNTGDPANAAPFYDKTPTNVYFDIAPLQYKGWDEYQAGVKELFAAFESMKFSLHDDARIHNAGNTAWGTVTWTAQGKMKNGNGVNLDGRWTCIWEKKGKNWLIVHEHFSAPFTPPSESRQP